MRRFAYWTCFGLVATGSTYGALSWFGMQYPSSSWVRLLGLFGSIVPPMFQQVLPRFVTMVVGALVLALVVRRAWMLLAKDEGVPASFNGTVQRLGVVGTWSFVAGVSGLVLSIVLGAGSGVPAGFLLLPAIFCVPWAFFLAEVRSFKAKNAAPPRRQGDLNRTGSVRTPQSKN